MKRWANPNYSVAPGAAHQTPIHFSSASLSVSRLLRRMPAFTFQRLRDPRLRFLAAFSNDATLPPADPQRSPPHMSCFATLDGTITKQQYDEKARTLQTQQDEIDRKLAAARETALIPLTTALDVARMLEFSLIAPIDSSHHAHGLAAASKFPIPPGHAKFLVRCRKMFTRYAIVCILAISMRAT